MAASTTGDAGAPAVSPGAGAIPSGAAGASLRRPATPAAGPALDRILRAARQGLGATGRVPPLAAIAREAGVSRFTLHRLVGSRPDLLRALDAEPDPTTRDRIRTQAAEMLAEHGLAHLSMDAVAERAGVSRASLYRLFPGKDALFREVVRAHAPFTPVATCLAEHAGEPPERVMPLLAEVALGSVEGRLGLYRTILLEVSGPDADAELGRELAFAEMIVPLAAYVVRQMDEGRLRRMDPVLALQAFAGPVVMHLITRPLAERTFGFDMPLREVGRRLAAAWLRAMSPDPDTAP